MDRPVKKRNTGIDAAPPAHDGTWRLEPNDLPVFVERDDDPERLAYRVVRRLAETDPPREPVIIKPNIVKPAPPPVTTDVRVVAGLIRALRELGITEMVVAEGSGTGDTCDNFRRLGYGDLGVPLVDLDGDESAEISVAAPRVWPTIRVSERLLDDVFIISVPVLKDHSMLGVTISLKNMVGCLSASHYAGYWTYKKSEIHRDRPHDCVVDVATTLLPHWAVVDALVGLRGSHIRGTPFDPPIGRVFASADPFLADVYGTGLLGHDWREIEYLCSFHDVPAALRPLTAPPDKGNGTFGERTGRPP